MHELKDKQVLVMGLGSFGGGAGVAGFCAARGARVTVTDLRPQSELSDSLRRLDGVPVRYRLGGHDEKDFTSADLIVVNPAVDRRGNQYLQAAERAGVPTTSEIGLLIERIDRGRVIGVTGTAGKSTTVAMIGHILGQRLGPRRVHVGGNIGGSLLSDLDSIASDHWVVLELSSFMLETLGCWSPHIAVMTNISDNHLDRHGTFEAYAAAKQNIFSHQCPGDFAVVTEGLPELIRPVVDTRTVYEPPEEGFPGLSIPGRHNRLNAMVALAVAKCAGVAFDDPDTAERVLRDFRGLPHRLQLVLEHNDVRYFNDSKSTTPDAATLAIDSFDAGRVHIILGGYDKKTDLTGLARHAAQRCATVYTIGQTGDTVARAAEEALGPKGHILRCQTLEVAVRQAVTNARPGQVVLLSPACASWDQFTNYEERGRLFAELALRYTGVE